MRGAETLNFKFERRANKLFFNFASSIYKSRITLIDHQKILSFYNENFSPRGAGDPGGLVNRYFFLPTLQQSYLLLFYDDSLSAKLVYANSFIRFKVLRRRYLAASFLKQSSMAIYGYNYSYLLSRFSEAVFERLLANEVILLEKRSGWKLYTVTLSISRERENEGALSLEFKADGKSLYVLGFSVVSGKLIGMDDDPVLLISRMQGRKRKYLHIRQATKALENISPQAILFAALRGLGQALAVNHIAGVCATNHLSFREDRRDSLVSAYDKFLASVGASQTGSQFYTLNLLEPEKPINSIKPGHRLRTKLKRRLKNEISMMVSDRILSMNGSDDFESSERAAAVREDPVRRTG